jgi:hypothetical protein
MYLCHLSAGDITKLVDNMLIYLQMSGSPFRGGRSDFSKKNLPFNRKLRNGGPARLGGLRI